MGNNPVNWIDPYGLRKYTIIDFEPLSKPFEMYAYKQEVLKEITKKIKSNDPCKDKWEKLYKSYSYWDVLIDFYRFDVDELMEYYQNKFNQKK